MRRAYRVCLWTMENELLVTVDNVNKSTPLSAARFAKRIQTSSSAKKTMYAEVWSERSGRKSGKYLVL